jgi:hypothetical protein
MHDNDTDYPHFNYLILNGTVSRITQGYDAEDLYLFGPGHNWYIDSGTGG